MAFTPPRSEGGGGTPRKKPDAGAAGGGVPGSGRGGGGPGGKLGFVAPPSIVSVPVASTDGFGLCSVSGDPTRIFRSIVIPRDRKTVYINTIKIEGV